MSTRHNYESTVMRIAGNLLSAAFNQADYQRLGLASECPEGVGLMAVGAVKLARLIVAEVQRTAPDEE